MTVLSTDCHSKLQIFPPSSDIFLHKEFIYFFLFVHVLTVVISGRGPSKNARSLKKEREDSKQLIQSSGLNYAPLCRESAGYLKAATMPGVKVGCILAFARQQRRVVVVFPFDKIRSWSCSSKCAQLIDTIEVF